jgi:head-tail adaptor
VRTPALTRLLTLESRTPVPDGGGGVVEQWTPLGAHWAEVLPSRAVERTLAGVTAAAVTHRIILRWVPFGAPARPGPHQRLRDGARVYEIVGVTEADARNAWLAAWAKETAL